MSTNGSESPAGGMAGPVTPQQSPRHKGGQVRWSAILGTLASLATIIGLVISIVALNPGLNPFRRTSRTPTPTATPTGPSYFAAAPGLGCDPGTAEWTSIAVSPDNGSVRCSSAGVTLVNFAKHRYLTGLSFSWPGHPFPRDYAVEVDAQPLTSHFCAGLATRVGPTGLTSYTFFICSGGYWSIYITDTNGVESPLLSGSVTPSSVYHMRVIVSGSSLGFSINHGPLATAIDATYVNTSELRLYCSVDTSFNTDSSVLFKNFRYTAMPTGP